ncbi:hypothetical protein BGZ83_003716 [Gryganskiella cystojenkinii]|nr:hypothetical protein BGZ83_003716 [Gryganskiella cystojenkinii]
MIDKNSPLQYQPSVIGNVVFGVLYLILGAMYTYHIIQHKNKWAICLPTGAFASSLGFFLRIALNPENLSIGLFVFQNILVICSPSAFLAFNYMLYGRLISAIDPEFDNYKSKDKMEKSRYSFIPPRIVGRVFVWSDITTFLIQVAAGSIQGNAGDNASLMSIGEKLYLVGVSAQGISYILFTLLLTVAIQRLVSERRQAGRGGLDHNTFLLVTGLYVSSVFVIIRSVYRVVEFVQGHDGVLLNTEVYLFTLDAAPLVLAIGIWAFSWPTVQLARIAAHIRGDGQALNAV